MKLNVFDVGEFFFYLVRMHRYACVISVCFNCFCLGNNKRWSTLYHHQLKPMQAQAYHDRTKLLFSKYETIPFTQLIFSWNALAQEKGYLSFEVMVRDMKTKKWGRWIKMVDWGKGRSVSYYSQVDDAAGFYHVRLEMPVGKKADAFRIKVSIVMGASISCLRALYASVSDYLSFRSEVGDKRLAQLSSVTVPGVVKYSQMKLLHTDAERMCSPTASSMLMNHLCKRQVDPLSFALKVYDRAIDTYGNWTFNAARAFEQCGTMHIRVERLNSFRDIHHHLGNQIPVVVSIRGSLPGGYREYQHGHLLLVVGYDAKKGDVICHDPAAPENYQVVTRYGLKHFLTAWERSRRLAYVAQPVS